MKIKLIAILLCASTIAHSQDWSAEARLSGDRKCFNSNGHPVCLRDGNRSNLYSLGREQLEESKIRGSAHALSYPVEITNLQIPYNNLETFFNSDSNSPLRNLIYKIGRKVSKFESFDDLFNWLGLHDYPKNQKESGPNIIAKMGELEKHQMGVSIYNHQNTKTMSFSCAACHSNNLFGTKVLGMTNRFPKANEIFALGKTAFSLTPEGLYQRLFKATNEEIQIFRKSKNSLNSVGVKRPKVLGLDTSLAQVGLSLARRNDDSYATKNYLYELFPKKTRLNKDPADSKPAVWWNLKYKTRWLSDGSIISGNPIFTNFLWNEIGRGVDLDELESWLNKNETKVKELTSFVFSTKAPQYNNFFPKKISIAKARRGEKLFLKNCKGCHGIYEKGWSQNHISEYKNKIKTIKTWYHEQTPVINIQTDMYRARGIDYFYESLNNLQISKNMGTVVKPQRGYVPPPLEGIWSRWPYFHNNSVPTLYDVLTSQANRPKTYIAVDSIDKEIDFDQVKNGYPAPEKIRISYRLNPDYKFDTNIKGLSNKGHSEFLEDEQGNDKFSHEEKLDLIEFLKTL